jgi:hypothetical protein
VKVDVRGIISATGRSVGRSRASLSSVAPGWPELLVAIVIGLPVLAHLGNLVARSAHPLFLEGDYAITEMGAIQASRGVRLVGMSSRFGWYHPGPLYFYLLAPFRALLPSSGYAIFLGAWCIAVAALVVTLWVAYRSGSRFWFLAVVFGLSRYLYKCPDQFLCLGTDTLPWTPYVTILPFCALLFAAADVPRRPWLLVVASSLATFVVQTHAGYLPAAGAICLLAVGFICGSWWHGRHAGGRPQRDRGPRYGVYLACACATSALLWTPPVIEQIRGAPGNLSVLASFFREDGDTGHPLSEAGRVLMRQSATALQSLTGDHLRSISTRQSLLLEEVLLGAGLIASVLTRRADLARLLALCLIGLLASVYSIVNIRGDVLTHLVTWMQVFHVTTWTASSYAVVAGLGQMLFEERLRRRLRPIATAATLALSVGYAASIALSHWHMATQPVPYQSSVLRERFTAALSTLMDERPAMAVVVEIGQVNWVDGAAVTATLLEASVPFTLSDDWKVFVDPSFDRPRRPTHILRTQVGPPSPGDGFSTLVRYGTHFVTMREVSAAR